MNHTKETVIEEAITIMEKSGIIINNKELVRVILAIVFTHGEAEQLKNSIKNL